MKHPNHRLTSFLTLHFRPSDHSTEPSRHGATAHQATPTAFAYQAAWSTRLYIPLSPAPLAPVSLASEAVRRAPCRLRYFAYISYSADIVAKDVMSTSPGRAYFLRWITRNHLQHFWRGAVVKTGWLSPFSSFLCSIACYAIAALLVSSFSDIPLSPRGLLFFLLFMD